MPPIRSWDRPATCRCAASKTRSPRQLAARSNSSPARYSATIIIEAHMTIASDEMTIPGEWHVRYNYSVGKVAGEFFDGLRDGKILATFCSKSGLAYLPPRAYCERSFQACDGWVEAGLERTIESGTIVSA